MQMEKAWLDGISLWSELNSSIAEVWLFGSRAKDRARDDSDVDLALVTAAPYTPGHDWAYGNAVALYKGWRAELEVIVGRHVSAEFFPFGSDLNIVGERVLLWRRR